MASVKGEKLWADAVRKAVHEYQVAKDDEGKVKKTRYLNLLAKTLVENGAKGDMVAIKEVGDRLDGKPGQSIESTVNVTVREIKEEFVYPHGYQPDDSDAPGLRTVN